MVVGMWLLLLFSQSTPLRLVNVIRHHEQLHPQ